MKKICIISLAEGFWDYFDEIFHKKEQVYLAKDVLSDDQKKSTPAVTEIYKSLKKLSDTLGANISQCYKPNSISDLFLIPFQCPDQKSIKVRALELTKKFLAKNTKYKFAKPKNLQVTVDRILFCLHSYSGLEAMGDMEISSNKTNNFLKPEPKNPVGSTLILPFPHRVQMVKQIKGLIQLFQNNVLAKMSEVLFLRLLEVKEKRSHTFSKEPIL